MGTYHESIIVKDFVNCVNDIIKKSFLESGYLIFANINTNNSIVERIRSDVLKTIHESNKYIVQVAYPDKKSIFTEGKSFNYNYVRKDQYNGMPVADYFVMIVEDYNDFSYLARKIVRSRFWNPYAKFVIMLIRFTKSDVENHKQIENILSCLFYYNAINVIIGVPKAVNIRNAIIYNWRPYDPPTFCGNLNDTAENRLVVENVCEKGTIKYDRDLFENKLPNDMKGCVLQIIALERQPFISINESDVNIEKILVNAMFKKFNFSLKYKTISGFRGERNQQGEWNGALEDLVSRKGHILLGGIFPDFDVQEDFECSSTYLTDSYIWVVPRAYPSPPWVSLTITFQNSVWYSAIGGFILCVLAWKFLGQLSGDSHYNKSFGHCLFNTWVCLLGFSANTRPKKHSLRIFFIFLNLYGIIFLTAYQTKLIDVLQNPTYESQIDNVEELVQSKLKFGGIQELNGLFFNSSDPFDNLVGEKWTDVSNLSQALRYVILHRNFSVLCSKFELEHLSAATPELNDAAGADNYYSFETITFSVPLEMIALRGFPFMKKISRSLNLYKQLGMDAKVRSYFAETNKRKRMKLLQSLQSTKEDFNALSIQHLQGGFFALAVGVSGGLFILLLELSSTNKFIRRKLLR
ncbi:uncharacterized protein LOC126769250 [Nymphalis io]|uniref:uncharacterized protein LOC126769250 n=1 Tax=Inachis io TaxID=171585 RepID=UPI00216A2FA8|nr:uncharacterized protein LOC126769250 [Nymphalis io]